MEDSESNGVGRERYEAKGCEIISRPQSRVICLLSVFQADGAERKKTETLL